jgi:hypothetical protein
VLLIGGSYRDHAEPVEGVITVFKGARHVFAEAYQSPFCIQKVARAIGSDHGDPPESAGLAVKLAVN